MGAEGKRDGGIDSQKGLGADEQRQRYGILKGYRIRGCGATFSKLEKRTGR